MRSRFVTSEQNPDIKRVKALRDRRSVRYAERLCIVEGPRFVADVATLARPAMLIVTEAQAEADLPLSDDLLVVPDALFARISDTNTPQGIIGIFPFPDVRASAEIVPLQLIADRIQDPGNLGAMIRSAAALGASRVICTPGTVDPLSPKVIRSAAAAQWQIAVEFSTNLAESIRDVTLVVADGAAEQEIDQVDMRGPTAIAIGSEGHGLSEAVLDLPHTAAAIPMSGLVESLNAAIAAGIALYEAQRQRQFGSA